MGGAFPKREIIFLSCHTITLLLHPKGRQSNFYTGLPEVVATELRVEAVTVELLPRLRPKLLPLLRLEETLTTGGGSRDCAGCGGESAGGRMEIRLTLHARVLQKGSAVEKRRRKQ